MCEGCNTPERIIMTRHPPTTGTHVVLRTILSAGVLAVLLVLACAGAAAGAMWDVYPGAGTPIQDAIDGTGEGIRFMCMPGRR